MGTNNAFTEATCDSFRAGSCKTNHKKSRNNVISLPEEEMKRSVPRGRNISKAGWADAKPMEVLVSALDNPAARVIKPAGAVRRLSALEAPESHLSMRLSRGNQLANRHKTSL